MEMPRFEGCAFEKHRRGIGLVKLWTQWIFSLIVYPIHTICAHPNLSRDTPPHFNVIATMQHPPRKPIETHVHYPTSTYQEILGGGGLKNGLVVKSTWPLTQSTRWKVFFIILLKDMWNGILGTPWILHHGKYINWRRHIFMNLKNHFAAV